MMKRVQELEMEAVGLTDHGNMYGAVEFYKAAKKAGIKPIIGMETYVAHGTRHSRDHVEDRKRYHLTLLVKNETGYKNLIQLSTKAHLEGFYYKPRIDRELLEKHHEGLMCLSGCFSSELARLAKNNQFEEGKTLALWYKDLFGDDYYLEIQPHTPEFHDFYIRLSQETGIPLVATQDSHYLRRDDKSTHEVLLAVSTGKQLDQEDRLSFKDYDGSFRSSEEMVELFKHIPEAVENTVKIADKVDFELKLGQALVPEFSVPEGETSGSYLRKLVDERTSLRYPELTEEVKKRIDYEVSIVQQMKFSDYFLVVQDFVNWAKQRGIVVGPGRGSAAGSVVSYILGITDIDPLQYGLLFERFLNPDRISMPDIDLDFTDVRRDEVLGYVREKYGEDRVAQIITFGTMAARAAVRDAGRAMGFSYSFCDEIAKLIPFHPSTEKESFLPKDIEAIPELKERYTNDPEAKRLLDTAMRLEGVVRHASVHACGVVIAKNPLTDYVPLQRSPQSDTTVITQFEMHSVEDLGLLKMDFLGLKNLTILEETKRLLKEIHNLDVEVSKVPLDDVKTFEMLRTAETTGVFQFESSGMRRYMKEIKPTILEDLIALVALFRPGPMELIPTFIRRKHNLEPITYLHPKLEPILKSTYGIGVYQEQMMRIATDLAGFTLAEGDTLRRAIGKKIKTLLAEQEEKLIQGLIKNGVEPRVAKQIWELFPAFARYGFNRSHAACYALIGYWTAYFKAHYPIEFMTALFNNDAEDIERIAFLITESRRMGIAVLPPDVNKSSIAFTPESQGIRFGLLAIKNLGAHIAAAILEERMRGGPYENFSDFMTRIHHKDLNKKSLESLIKSGALDSLITERRATLEQVEYILKMSNGFKKSKDTSQTSLFGQAPRIELRLHSNGGDDRLERLQWEKELLGLYVTDHPLKSYVDSRPKGLSSIKDILQTERDGVRAKTFGLIVRIQRFTTKLGQPMLFARIEDLQDTIEVLVFSDVLAKTAEIWQENNIIQLSGKVSRRNGEFKLICNDAKIVQLQ